MKIILRGDLYYADLDPVVGSEQGGIRPVIVISNILGNIHSPTVIVAAISGNVDKGAFPLHHCLNERYGLERDSIILLEQIRTIDKQRLKQHIGRVVKKEMKYVNKVLADSLSLRRK